MTLEDFLFEFDVPSSKYPQEFTVNAIDVVKLDRINFAVFNPAKQAWDCTDNRDELINLISGQISRKDDLIKEAMAAVHDEDKSKALSLLSDALRL